MPHGVQEKKRALIRLKKIKGQAEALEKAISEGSDCGKILQQIAALRGAANGLMVEVLDSHMRETFGTLQGKTKTFDVKDEINLVTKIMSTYLK